MLEFLINCVKRLLQISFKVLVKLKDFPFVHYTKGNQKINNNNKVNNKEIRRIHKEKIYGLKKKKKKLCLHTNCQFPYYGRLRLRVAIKDLNWNGLAKILHSSVLMTQMSLWLYVLPHPYIKENGAWIHTLNQLF